MPQTGGDVKSKLSTTSSLGKSSSKVSINKLDCNDLNHSTIPVLPLISKVPPLSAPTKPKNKHIMDLKKKVKAKAMQVAFLDSLRNNMLCAKRNPKPRYDVAQDIPPTASPDKAVSAAIDSEDTIYADKELTPDSSLTSAQVIQDVHNANISADILGDLALQDSSPPACSKSTSPNPVQSLPELTQPIGNHVQIAFESSTKMSAKPVVVHPTSMNKVSIHHSYAFGKFSKAKYSSLMRPLSISPIQRRKKVPAQSEIKSSLTSNESDVSGLGYIASVPSSDLGSTDSVPPFVIKEEVLQRLHKEKKRNRYYALGGRHSVSSLEGKRKELVSHGTETEEGRILIGRPWSATPATRSKSDTSNSEKTLTKYLSVSYSSSALMTSYMSVECPTEALSKEVDCLKQDVSGEQERDKCHAHQSKSDGASVRIYKSVTSYINRGKHIQDRADKAASKWLESLTLKKKTPVIKVDSYREPSRPVRRYVYYKRPIVKRLVKQNPNACIHGLKRCMCKSNNWLEGKSFGVKTLRSQSNFQTRRIHRKAGMFSVWKTLGHHKYKRFCARRPLLCTERLWIVANRHGIYLYHLLSTIHSNQLLVSTLTFRGGTGMKNQVQVGYRVFKKFKYGSNRVRVHVKFYQKTP